ncbi:MAG: hypothetical protein DRP50_00105 [Thermotoga sp.]|nr:sugar ABC transporter permease [Thermotogota bacterium]RKX56487.1 MAG: hypothetical protein DRP50_00105 [Thermotoga sp.]
MKSKFEFRYQKIAYLYLIIPVVFYSVFIIFPVGFSIFISLRRWNMLVPISVTKFVGFKNYLRVFKDPVFLMAFKNTAIYTSCILLIGIPLSIIIAVLLSKLKRNAFWRYILFIPSIVPLISIGMVWAFLYDPTWGPINTIIRIFGLPVSKWLWDTKTAMFSVTLVGIWATLGINTLISYMGVKEIPISLYEAAEIDGGNEVKKFFYITLPLLKPIISFLMITNLINSFQIFDLVVGLTGQKLAEPGGPANSTQVLVLYMYQTAFKYLKMGKASAMAFILFLLLFSTSIVFLKSLKKSERENY